VERIAPCLPGAELQEVEGDDYRGIVKVKVGPITASYKGTARFEEKDDTAHRGVLKAEGRETRGQGNASATIVATLSPSGEGTKVEVVTDLAITGKVAQFGRGVLADVSGKLLEQFVHNLESMVLAPAAAAGDTGSAAEVAAAPSAEAPATPAPKAAGAAKSSRSKATKSAVAAPARRAASGGDATARTHDTAEPAASGGSDVAKDASESAAVDGAAAQDAAAEDAAVESDAADADAGAGVTGTSAAEAGRATVRRIDSVPAVPVDLGRIAGPSVARRLIPFASVAGALFLIRVVVYALRRRKK
jgi:carbon monoxide dehydrogenase subunit G